MCLLIATKKEGKVSNNKLHNAWQSNNDGVGYAFVNNGKIEIKKFMEFKPFKNEYNQDFKRHGRKSAFLIHFRYATHGITNLTNVHPFRVNENLVFGHNGMINNVDDDKKLSDTRIFNNLVLKKLENDFLNSSALRLLISDFIGTSKLAFLDISGNINIINESLGHWDNTKKIWFSNDGYKKTNYGVTCGYAINWDKGYNRNYVAKNQQFQFQRDEKKDAIRLICDGCQTLYNKKESYYVGDSQLCKTCADTFMENVPS